MVDNLPVRQPENYPYDIVWGANTKDKAFIEKLKEKYNVQTEFIPSIRVTSGNCAEHTGISATEYKRLTGKQVHLKNDEIYVVYQWDRSEYGTIGLDFGKLKPRLYTGCATADIWIILREHYQIINLQENIQLREMTEESLPGILKQGF